MADNRVQATLVPDVRLTDDLRVLLQATGATCERQDEGTDYVFWEDHVFEEVEIDLLDDPADDRTAALLRLWQGKGLEEVLQAVLNLNPEAGYCFLEGASTCSKMRPGEFGGFSLTVTRTEYCWINSSMVEIDPATFKLHVPDPVVPFPPAGD